MEEGGRRGGTKRWRTEGFESRAAAEIVTLKRVCVRENAQNDHDHFGLLRLGSCVCSFQHHHHSLFFTGDIVGLTKVAYHVNC